MQMEMAGSLWLLLLISASGVLGAIMISDLEVEKSWLEFKKEHGKVYSSRDEEAYRKSVFEKSLQEVFEHQLAYERGDESYYIGINQFSDMTFEEFLEHRSITCEVTSNAYNVSRVALDVDDVVAELGLPPAAVDWNAKGFVSHVVKDQRIGQCGGCYAFAAVGAIESAYAVKKSLKNKVPVLSVQEIIDCGKPYGCNGCKGGHPCSAYDTVKGLGGLAHASEYEWRKTQDDKGKCQFNSKDHKKFKSPVQVTAYNELNKVTNMDYNLVVMLAAKGPSTVSVCVNDKFKGYKGGVFEDATCLKTCSKKYKDGMNHSVLAIAYDANTVTIRNSWGKKWGEQGNMRIKRVKGDKVYGNCGLAIDVSFPLVA